MCVGNALQRSWLQCCVVVLGMAKGGAVDVWLCEACGRGSVSCRRCVGIV